MSVPEVFIILCCIYISTSSYVTVEIHPNLLTNIISDEFLSFNVEPNFIFDSKGFLNRDKLSCLENSLSPAYLRIKGPTTDNLLLENSILKRKGISPKKNILFKKLQGDKGEFNFEQLGLFFDWIQSTNFTPFVVVNNIDRNANGDWNTKMVIRTLSLADTLEVGDSVWQLDTDCKSIQLPKYINDLKTFDSILETFDMVKNEKWMVTGGDISQCLGEDLKEDLKTILSSDDSVLEAMVMNNDSHLETLDVINEENPGLLRDIILYKTLEDNNGLTDDVKALNLLNSLGVAAFNGYAAVFRDLNDDFSKPTLTYYSSLLYKKLVGRRVLYTSETDPEQGVSVFAHCATLSGGPVAGGVTIFATNFDKEKKTISIDLAVDEEDSEVMQYVLSLNDQGKIVINENVMTSEEDLKPIVLKVRSFKTLSIILPPRSFGFWVVSNTNVQLCALDEDFVENMYNKLNSNHELFESKIENTEIETLTEENIRSRRNSDDQEATPSNIDIIAMNKNNEKMDINKHFVDAAHIEPEEINILVTDPNKDKKINDFKYLFNILGQLVSLIELQEEFLHISNDLLKPPMGSLMNQESMKLLSNDAQELSDMFPLSVPPETIRVERSIDQEVSEVVTSETTTEKDNELFKSSHSADQKFRSTREAEGKSCSDLDIQREKINIILNKLRNRKPFALNLDNVLPIVRSSLSEETENVGLQSKNIPLLQLPQDDTEPGDVMVRVGIDQNNILDAISDSINADGDEESDRVVSEDQEVGEEIVGAELTDDNDDETNPAVKKTFIVDPMYDSLEDENLNEIKPTLKPKIKSKMPTLPPLLKVTLPKLPGKSLIKMKKQSSTKSMNDLVEKAQNLLVKVDPKAKDDDTLESKVLEERVGAPAPLLPIVYRDQLAAQLQMNRLKMQELRNKIQLKLAELRAKQFLDRSLPRLFKRSVDSKLKKTQKKTMKNHFNFKKLLESTKFAKYKNSDKMFKETMTNNVGQLNAGIDPNSLSRKKRLVSNDIDGDINELDNIKPLYDDKESNKLDGHSSENADNIPVILNSPVTLKTLSEVATEFSTQEPESTKVTIMSNEIIKETDQKSVEESEDVKISSYVVKPNSINLIQSSDETKLSGNLDKNVDLTIDWLSEVIENLKQFITNVHKKVAESWILKNLYQ